MSRSQLPVYHIDQQFAPALLRPVEATLQELVERLAQYSDRLRLTDDDRAAIERAEEAVIQARGAIHTIVANSHTPAAQ